MLAQVPRWLLERDGPLRVHWRYAPQALPWLLKWLRASRRSQALCSGEAIAPLVRGSVEEYRSALGPGRFNDLIIEHGQLLVSTSPAKPGADDVVAVLRKRHNVPIEMVGADEIQQLEPALGPQFQSGLFIHDSAHTVNPARLTQAMAEAAMREGATFLRTDVRGFRLSQGRVIGTETGAGSLEADTIVLAAGVHSRALATQLGDKIPLESERGYHVMFADPGVATNRPIGNMDKKFFSTTLETGLRVAGTVEIAGLEAPPDPRRTAGLIRSAQEMFPALKAESTECWLGHRPSLPDSLPVIGPANGHPNVIYAFGHGHIGLTAGPVTGRMVAALCTGTPAPAPTEPYLAARFRA
jgi:D-amino-acid dehydrogenase